MGVRAGWEGAPAPRAPLPGWDRAPGPAVAAAAAAARPTLHHGIHRTSEPPSRRPLGRRKKPVCVLRLPCDSGSCLLAGASIPTQLDWGATLPGAAKRANETTKRHKMNRQSNQPKTRGSSTPARRHLLLPSLEAL
ncbi:unnamed protein product [Rangifer tarandus platyrhynchus]|uniref:Uncharacterized protein n=1 Tax=Rangifer tarandus platyrhynchus TaxID=3082113 RepID=A0ABN8ZG55_RANTA|nr:unnamed protein product [Rangifer tarandus platyrhynchus]CAI9689172.1 unnamed protein product [Rangifer tarandus platyrhynchus]